MTSACKNAAKWYVKMNCTKVTLGIKMALISFGKKWIIVPITPTRTTTVKYDAHECKFIPIAPFMTLSKSVSCVPFVVAGVYT